jgi:thymidylate synthase (FAD)
MILRTAAVEFVAGPAEAEALAVIEAAGRTCYKSEARSDGTLDGSRQFVRMLLARKHESVLEHVSYTLRFICDRGISHELVRHRLASFSQESTRYVDYTREDQGGGCQFITPDPQKFPEGGYRLTPDGLSLSKMEVALDAAIPSIHAFVVPLAVYPAPHAEWFRALLAAEASYKNLREAGWSPQEARSVLPHALKTEVVVTANVREWRHIFDLRLASGAHPQMRELMRQAYGLLESRVPVLFENIGGVEP